MKPRTSRLNAEESKLLTKVMTMGLGTNLPVVMTPSKLVRLIGVIYHDTEMGVALEKEIPGLWAKINLISAEVKPESQPMRPD